ncbi:MAG: cation:dicarboxylase symporter family transporter [Spirochaetaceae bacterium]|jgi:Na+/H+-dicarboxylate symporter|nr:cation:dicarboxylase symporter family transporter [Spirochaetaceae bacterium]
MKVWLKLLIGSILGLVLGFLVPNENVTVSSVIDFLQKFAIGAGRYTAVPLLVFSLTVGIYELRQDGRFWSMVGRTLLLIVVTSALVISLGIVFALVFQPDHIPILEEQQAQDLIFNPAQNILDIFPPNMLSVFTNSGIYLFPVCILAFFLAIGLGYDKNYTKPVLSMIDSLSRIFFHIVTLFSEVLGLFIIVLAAYWAIQYRAVQDIEIFKSIMQLLLVFSLILALIVLPMLLFLVRKKQKPWKVLYGYLGAAISAFFSGDINFSLPVLMMHTKANMGIRRRSGSVTAALWTTFGRAGSAMVAAISFIVIIKSYNTLAIEAGSIIKIGLHAMLLSFLLARNPADGAFIALAVLCSGYGHGYETGFLILKPIAFYLIAIGTFIDMILAALGSFAVAQISGFQEDFNSKHFV